MTDSPVRMPPRHIRCRNTACGQILAVQIDGWLYRPLADIQASQGGRVTFVCPGCSTRRKFDDDAWRFGKVQEAA